MANSFQMPLRGTENAPRFNGKIPAQLSHYLLDKAEVWQTLPEASAPYLDNFVATVKDLYP